MGNVTALNGVIGQDCHTVMSHEVNMGSTTRIVSSKDCVESRDTVIVCSLKSTQEGVVLSTNTSQCIAHHEEKNSYKISWVLITVAIAVGLDTRVDSGSIGLPSVHIQTRHRLAGTDINVLILKMNSNTFLSVNNVTADELARDIVRPKGDFGSQDAGNVLVVGK